MCGYLCIFNISLVQIRFNLTYPANAGQALIKSTSQSGDRDQRFEGAGPPAPNGSCRARVHSLIFSELSLSY